MLYNSKGAYETMINSVNTVDLDFGAETERTIISHGLVPHPKLSSIMQQHALKLPQRFCTNSTETTCVRQPIGVETFNTKDNPEDNASRRERVTVQHIETPTNFESNLWNRPFFYSLNTGLQAPVKVVPSNECAFTDYKPHMDAKHPYAFPAGAERNNNNVSIANKQASDSTNAIANNNGGRLSSPTRTEDQENAFRRIDDVHNYAKPNCYGYGNVSSNSSEHEEEEDEDDDNDEEEEVEAEDEDYAAVNNYARYANHKQKATRQALRHHAETETDAHVDVETVQKDQYDLQTVSTVTPEHHARRPMNAFLIFCKRHRAIVKEKYKSLENRAITKILGDWWASLDANDKKCFTELAQQNKDAFFNANPNFKWYKLPAPPLRTLSTRPGHTERSPEPELEENRISTEKTTSTNYFKLADVAQMGELSSLMCEKAKPQQSSHQSPAAEQETSCKRRLYSGNSFSSNSSEDDVVPKKSSRLCKGKKYQELINSGQITPVSKKPKGTKHSEPPVFIRQEGYVIHHMQHEPLSPESADFERARQRTISEASSTAHYDCLAFDLEEKIKELPALSLDAYLQRKRNNKKKKKFTAKKRSSNSTSSYKSFQPITIPSPPITPPKEQPSPVVGSRKRKARKESITRRDVSAIENEVRGFYYNEPVLLSPVSAPAQEPQFTGSFGAASYNDNLSTSDLLILAEVAANRTELTN